MSLHFGLMRDLLKRRRVEHDGVPFGRDPRADWRRVLLFFLSRTRLLSAVGAFVYRGVNRGELFLVEKREPVSLGVLKRQELEETVAFFEEKRARFEALRRTPLKTADPYIPKTPPKKQSRALDFPRDSVVSERQSKPP